MHKTHKFFCCSHLSFVRHAGLHWVVSYLVFSCCLCVSCVGIYSPMEVCVRDLPGWGEGRSTLRSQHRERERERERERNAGSWFVSVSATQRAYSTGLLTHTHTCTLSHTLTHTHTHTHTHTQAAQRWKNDLFGPTECVFGPVAGGRKLAGRCLNYSEEKRCESKNQCSTSQEAVWCNRHEIQSYQTGSGAGGWGGARGLVLFMSLSHISGLLSILKLVIFNISVYILQWFIVCS